MQRPDLTRVKLTVWTRSRPRPPFAVTCATKPRLCHLPQVLEDTTGVRRVVVTPQSPECYPPSYSPALSPTHHLPPYLAHPHFIPNSHTFYPPVSPGELPPHQYYQHHLPPMYGDPGRACVAPPPFRIRSEEVFQPVFFHRAQKSSLFMGCQTTAEKTRTASHSPKRQRNRDNRSDRTG